MKPQILFFSLAVMLLIAGCEQDADDIQLDTGEVTTDYTEAVAVIHPTEGNEISGTVTFSEADEGVRVHAEIEGLEDGNNGFHIHEFGDCSAPDASSAGGHFNPEDEPHGGPDDEERHVGDMGNIEGSEDEISTRSYEDEVLNLNGPNSIIGHAVVIHAEEDDLESQPTGDAGDRLGCGVIGIGNAEAL